MVEIRDEAVEPLSPRAERTVAELFTDLTREASCLIRQEIALAKAEVANRIGQAAVGAVELVAGALVAFAGVLALLAAAVLGLAEVLPAWLAALLIGIGTTAVGAGLAFKGKRDVEPRSLVPSRTLRTLREDAEWAREQFR